MIEWDTRIAHDDHTIREGVARNISSRDQLGAVPFGVTMIQDFGVPVFFVEQILKRDAPVLGAVFIHPLCRDFVQEHSPRAEARE